MTDLHCVLIASSLSSAPPLLQTPRIPPTSMLLPSPCPCAPHKSPSAVHVFCERRTRSQQTRRRRRAIEDEIGDTWRGNEEANFFSPYLAPGCVARSLTHSLPELLHRLRHTVKHTVRRARTHTTHSHSVSHWRKHSRCSSKRECRLIPCQVNEKLECVCVCRSCIIIHLVYPPFTLALSDILLFCLSVVLPASLSSFCLSVSACVCSCLVLLLPFSR